MLKASKIKLFNKLIVKTRIFNYSSSIIECLRNKSIVLISGDDSKDFIQGHITNNINLLDNQQCKSIYSMILNHQGRVLYDIILYSVNKSFYIECEKNISADLIKHLLRYKLRKKINIALDESFSIWVSFSKNLDLSEKNKILIKESVTSSDDPRLPNLCHRYLISSSINENDLKISDCEHAYGLYGQLRYKNGVGEGPVDFLTANCFPLESNLDFLNGVSFEKGCYVGQELTARTHHTGVIRKRLMPLVIKEPTTIQPGASVENTDGKNIGKVRNFIGIYGSGLLRVEEAMKTKKILIKNKDDVIVEAMTHIPSWWLQDSDEIVKLALKNLKKTLN